MSDLERVTVAVGAGLTTALLVAAAVTELLAVEFSALVGLPVGLVAGLAALVAVAVAGERLGPTARRAVSAYAAFGPTVLVVLGLAYVNIARGIVTVTRAAAAGVVVSLALYLSHWVSERLRA